MRLSALILILTLAACTVAPSAPPADQPTLSPATVTPFPSISTPSPWPTETPVPPTGTPTPTPASRVPQFYYIYIFFFENKEFGIAMDTYRMPRFTQFAAGYSLLTQYYATTHPSLPNYISLIGGDTFGITSNCSDCFIDAPSLPDLIEQSGRTWKTYQEDMPVPCYVGDTTSYVQKHNPFIYFDPIRTDIERCQRSIVPLTTLDDDIAANALPNFGFITPNLCHSGHDCPLPIVDEWLGPVVDKLQSALEATGRPYLIVLTWDEGQGEHSCCGLGETAGGRIATILISSQVQNGFKDDTPYTHYSLLRTIAGSWDLPLLGKAADPLNVLIEKPWK